MNMDMFLYGYEYEYGYYIRYWILDIIKKKDN
jgi:hypothetical protein